MTERLCLLLFMISRAMQAARAGACMLARFEEGGGASEHAGWEEAKGI